MSADGPFVASESGANDVQGKSKGGRKAGAINWTEQQTDVLFDIIDKFLPTGSKQWEFVALQLHEKEFQNERHVHLK